MEVLTGLKNKLENVFRIPPDWIYSFKYHLFYVEHEMLNYFFFQKGKQIVVLESSDVGKASQLIEHGYEKQFEEVSATNEKNALARFADIRRDNQIDRDDFLAGAGPMPLIDGLTAIAAYLFSKK
jgi:hypothetical protein